MAEATATTERKTLPVEVRRKVCWESQFLQGSWNYERMQNLGWCYALIPAIKYLYGDDQEQIKQALLRHMEFFNTHPYLASPVFGVTLALEEDKANGADIDNEAFQGVKVGMMGPLAGVGDPVFWGTIRPILGALAASLALGGSIAGPIIFFVVWNIIRIAFLWYTQEAGYKAGTSITKDLSGGILKKVTTGAGVLGMFIMGVLVPKWATVNLSKMVLSSVEQTNNPAATAYPNLSALADAINSGNVNMQQLFNGYGDASSLAAASNGTMSISDNGFLMQTTTLQDVFNQLCFGLAPLGLTFLSIWLLRKKVSPIVIIFGMFAVGILFAWLGWM